MQLVSVKYFLNLNRYNSSKGKAIGVWRANIGENGLLKKIFLLIYFVAIRSIFISVLFLFCGFVNIQIISLEKKLKIDFD